MALISTEDAKAYLRVDSSDEDATVGILLASAIRLCIDIARLTDDQWEVIDSDAASSDEYTEAELSAIRETMKVAILYTCAYLFEHREEADHHVMHETEDANGVIVENKDVEPEHFALLFEFSGDQRKIRHCMYYCSATRPSVTGSTKEDSTEVQTETLSITASPLPSGIVKVKTGTNTTSAVYDAWYSSVYEPSASVSSGE